MGKKEGKKAGEWKKTIVPIIFHVVRGCGQLTRYIKWGYRLVDLGSRFAEEFASKETEQWELFSADELIELYKILPEEFKKTAVIPRGTFPGMEYDDWDEGEEFEDDYGFYDDYNDDF